MAVFRRNRIVASMVFCFSIIFSNNLLFLLFCIALVVLSLLHLQDSLDPRNI